MHVLANKHEIYQDQHARYGPHISPRGPVFEPEGFGEGTAGWGSESYARSVVYDRNGIQITYVI